jgi:predicted P-loop ATPase
MPTTTEELIDFRQYLDFNSSNRAQCPVCIADGKKNRNIAISPEGKIKCHRDCSFPDILNALGIDTKAPANQAPVAKRITAQSATTTSDKKPVYQSLQQIESNHQTLLTQSKIAKEWLAKRGIDEQAIARHKLGIAKYSFRGKTYPCITIPYNRKGGWQNKYFPAPWLPKAERLDGEGEETRAMQDTGSKADWYFTLKNNAPELWIVEGEWDAMLLAGDFIANNITNIDICTGTGGCGTIPIDMSPLDSYQHIYIWYDLDYVNSKGKRPGPDGSAKLAAKIGDRAISCTVPHPDDHKDGWDVSDALLNGFTIADFERVKYREYTEVEKKAIDILWKLPKSFCHKSDTFAHIGSCLKQCGDLYRAWYDWGYKNYSPFCDGTPESKDKQVKSWDRLPVEKNIDPDEALFQLQDAGAEFEDVKPIASKPAVLNHIRKMWQSRLSLNTMSKNVELDGVKLMPDYLYLDLMQYGIISSKDFVIDCVAKFASENQYNPLTTYLTKCADKFGATTTDLLDKPSQKYLGTSDPIYDAMLKKTLISAVARAFNPGCKVDTVLILHGGQGYRKSTFFKVLAGDWFNDDLGSNVSDPNEKMKLSAAWFLEWGELERIFNQRDASSIKSFLTSTSDMYRRPWGKTVEPYPRHSIIVGSSNRDDFLNDATGDRRYWIIPIQKRIDTDLLEADRDAIWAAAVALYNQKQSWELSREEEVERAIINAQFQREDPWKDAIEFYCEGRHQVSVSEIMTNVIKLELSKQGKADQMRVGDILRVLKYTKKKTNGKALWYLSVTFNKNNNKSDTTEGLEDSDTSSDTSVTPLNSDTNSQFANSSVTPHTVPPPNNEVALASMPYQESDTANTVTPVTPTMAVECFSLKVDETAKIPFFAGQVVRAKSGGLVGQNLTIQSVNAKTCIVRKDGASSTIELPTKILEKV